MSEPSRMPRYDVRNDGVGPYAVFYCESCDREHRSQPDVTATITKDVSRKTMGGLLRNIPVVGGAVASSLERDDPRYSYTLTPQQVDKAWGQIKDRFRECSTCRRVVCLSDWDELSGSCAEDSPRRDAIAQAQAEQAGAMLKGFVAAVGLGDSLKRATDAARQAQMTVARCPQDGTQAPAGTKFCPNCGNPMLQPQPQASPAACPNCGAETKGAKFCPECGTKVEPKLAAVCPNCGAEAKGAKFCPECGTKLV